MRRPGDVLPPNRDGDKGKEELGLNERVPAPPEPDIWGDIISKIKPPVTEENTVAVVNFLLARPELTLALYQEIGHNPKREALFGYYLLKSLQVKNSDEALKNKLLTEIKKEPRLLRILSTLSLDPVHEFDLNPERNPNLIADLTSLHRVLEDSNHETSLIPLMNWLKKRPQTADSYAAALIYRDLHPLPQLQTLPIRALVGIRRVPMSYLKMFHGPRVRELNEYQKAIQMLADYTNRGKNLFSHWGRHHTRFIRAFLIQERHQAPEEQTFEKMMDRLERQVHQYETNHLPKHQEKHPDSRTVIDPNGSLGRRIEYLRSQLHSQFDEDDTPRARAMRSPDYEPDNYDSDGNELPEL